MTDQTPKITVTMMPGGDVWRVYCETEPGRGRYVDVDDYDHLRPYVLSRRPKAELLDIYPYLRGDETL